MSTYNLDITSFSSSNNVIAKYLISPTSCFLFFIYIYPSLLDTFASATSISSDIYSSIPTYRSLKVLLNIIIAIIVTTYIQSPKIIAVVIILLNFIPFIFSPITIIAYIITQIYVYLKFKYLLILVSLFPYMVFAY